AFGTAMNLPTLITAIFSIILSPFTGFWGMLALGLIAGMMWIFGIHGTMMVVVVLMPLMMQAATANAEAYQAGGVEALVYYPVTLFGMMACAGGTGNTFALAILGMKAKSEQLRAVSKAAIGPGFFNINEPIIFGFPIMYNAFLAIPFLLSMIVPMILAHIFYSLGILRPGFVALGSVMPIGVSEFITTGSIINVLFAFAMIGVTLAIYYPFLKAYDKQLYEKEQSVVED
ncbi:MAG: PTS transporter subunit EIIC, partial [Lactovum sp.]